MKFNKLPDWEFLDKTLSYDSVSGDVTWKVTRGSRGIQGSPIRTYNDSGYLIVRLQGVIYRLHRIIWKLVTHVDPIPFDIDHLNNIKDDNRWENLRLATSTENSRNVNKRKDNTSGIKGVSWVERKKLWRAYVGLNGKQLHLGYFRLPEHAAEKVREYREEKHKEFANHG